METAFLLLHGHLPTESEIERFERQVVQSREVPGFVLESLEKFPRQSDPMDVLQACVPMLAMADPDLNDESREANVRKAIRLIARFPCSDRGLASDKERGEGPCARQCPVSRRQFPMAVNRKEAGQGNRPRSRRLPDPACRPHLQRFDIRLP